MRPGAYKQLITYREMRRWMKQLRVPKADILLSILWEHCFDHAGNHKRECKLPLKQLFPVRTPTAFREFELSVQSLGIMTLKGNHTYTIGHMTKQIFADAIEEIRMWKSIQSRIKALEVELEGLETKTAKKVWTLEEKIEQLNRRIDVLTGNSITLVD